MKVRWFVTEEDNAGEADFELEDIQILDHIPPTDFALVKLRRHNIFKMNHLILYLLSN